MGAGTLHLFLCINTIIMRNTLSYTFSTKRQTTPRTIIRYVKYYLRLAELKLNYLLTPFLTNGMKMSTGHMKMQMLELKQEYDRLKLTRTGNYRKPVTRADFPLASLEKQGRSRAICRSATSVFRKENLFLALSNK
jgi:hypothetical protein